MNNYGNNSVTISYADYLPWLFVVGIAIYMFMPNEPALELWFVLLGSIGGGILFSWKTRKSIPIVLTCAVILVTLGLSWGWWTAHRLNHTVLKYPVWSDITGTVEKVMLRHKGYRVLLQNVRVEDGHKNISLHRVRIYIPGRYPTPEPGDLVKVKGALSPPPEPVYPYAYNMPRRAWFQDLAAVGFTNSRWQRLAKPDDWDWRYSVNAWRQHIRHNVLQSLGRDSPQANIVVALLVGERGGIADNIVENYRGAGMAHMLAISGLHMGLIAGLAFIVLRRVLCCFSTIALLYPIKKWAAFGAFLVAAMYLVLSGASVPTQRAFIMTAITLAAVIFERSPLSLRLVGLAAVSVVLLSPEAVTGASFQMSFSAVLALISVYQGKSYRSWFPTWGTIPRHILMYVIGIIMTTVIASAATAPVAIYHFGHVASYAVVANVFALPVLGLWIMPWAVVAIILMPFGLAHFALMRMSDGVTCLNAIAAKIVCWPQAVLSIPQMPHIGFLLCLIGGIWLLFFRYRYGILAILLLGGGLSSPWWSPQPDVLIANKGGVIAIRQSHGYGLISSGRDKFVRSVWEASTAQRMRKKGWNCDDAGCIGRSSDGWLIARSNHPASLVTDCKNAAVVVARYSVEDNQRISCQSTILIDEKELYRSGSMNLWLNKKHQLYKIIRFTDFQKHRIWQR